MRSHIHLFLALAALLPMTAQAWIYPEHRNLAVLAVEKLDPDRALVFSQLWREACAMLFNEAFALHFLEDGYASGHIAGTWVTPRSVERDCRLKTTMLPCSRRGPTGGPEKCLFPGSAHDLRLALLLLSGAGATR